MHPSGPSGGRPFMVQSRVARGLGQGKDRWAPEKTFKEGADPRERRIHGYGYWQPPVALEAVPASIPTDPCTWVLVTGAACYGPGRAPVAAIRRWAGIKDCRMPPYPKYATTVIGAHSVPDWYEALDRLVAVGQLSMASMADAQYRSTEAAVLEQEIAGIDVITGGEMHRRTHNRHSPPNAMLNFFWQRIPAFQGSTRPKPITKHDPDVFHPAATCKSRIETNVDLGLVDEFKTVSALTRKPVKITMTGPHMLSTVAYDEYYNDLSRMMADVGKLLRHNFKLLVEAGCRYIQIDEPLFTASDDKDVQAAVDAVNLAIEDLPDSVHTSMHICQGNYAVGKEYDGQIGHRYFDIGRYKADIVCKIECCSYMVEYDMAHHYQDVLGNKQLGVGAVDVQDPKVETAEIIAGRIKAQKWLAPEQTVVTSSCGFNHLPRFVAFAKMKAMAEAKRILGG
jgi:5-methyltetrahydropteroyltriglutamate--homocysteine methyltransferase